MGTNDTDDRCFDDSQRLDDSQRFLNVSSTFPQRFLNVSSTFLNVLNVLNVPQL